MPEKTAEQLTRETKMFGCTVEDLEAYVEEARVCMVGSMQMLALSVLSDAQEELQHEMFETARQTINRAKWIINNHLQDKS